MLPFRPYKRFVPRMMPIEESHNFIQLGILESQAEEEELTRLGGRAAVLASIKRHLPTFDPAQAQEPYGPAWVALKPILVKCGLNPVDENTTLTDIKSFLDHATPEQAVGPEVVVSDSRNVFVIHGRNGAARDAMFDFLRALGLNPIEWSEAVGMTKKAAPYIGEILDAAFGNAQAVVAVFTGDDVACLREELQKPDDQEYEKKPTPQARPNVLFEAGMAFGRHPERTMMVEIGNLRPFSDVAGRHTIRFAGTAEQRAELRERLKTAHCAIKDAGTAWLKAGNFEEAVKLATPVAPRSKRRPANTKVTKLSPEAKEILLAAAKATGPRQGKVLVSHHMQGAGISMGADSKEFGLDDNRVQAKYLHAIEELVARGFLVQRSESLYEATEPGYAVAEQLPQA